MRRYLSRTRGVLTALLAGAAVLSWSVASFAATPLLGPDCGATGASIVGSDVAGKVTIGAPPLGMPITGTCTIEFSVPALNPPACTAVNETNGGGFAVAVGARTTTATVEIDAINTWVVGDVISYSCVGY